MLPGTLVDVDKSAIPKDMLQLGAKWFGVNYQYAGQMLLKVFKDNKKLTLNAKKMAIINKSKFSLDNMTKEFEKILDKHLPNFVEPPKAVDLKLPKLKKIGDAAPPTIKLPKLKKV